ncbi:MAG TPA: oxidoreductase [Sphingobium sp.]|uniref:oxidoreductase n=1 Tax=Sphingobium sp. TaxID=1912891 RepID=UPI002ED27D0E
MQSQAGKTAIVTGTGGLGFEVALALSRAEATVILAGRDEHKGKTALREIRTHVRSANLAFAQVDLADLSSVALFADRLLRQGVVPHILVNNAGIMSPPVRKTTQDGFEMQFGVNYLGHFAMTLRLLPALARAGGARVVNVTSLAHHPGRIGFDDLQGERTYKPGLAYCQSKLAQAIFARELQRRCSESALDIVSVAAHPGFAKTSIFENSSGAGSLVTIISKFMVGPILGHSAASGALSLLYGATDPAVVKGALYGPTGLFGMKGPPGVSAYASHALDTDVAARLWVESEKMTGLEFRQIAESII